MPCTRTFSSVTGRRDDNDICFLSFKRKRFFSIGVDKEIALNYAESQIFRHDGRQR